MRAVLAEGGKSSIPPEPQHAESITRCTKPSAQRSRRPASRRLGVEDVRVRVPRLARHRAATGFPPPTLDPASYQLTCLARKQPHCVKGTGYRPGGCNPDREE